MIKDELVGSWRLVQSVFRDTSRRSLESDPLAGSTGVITYSSDMRMSVQVMTESYAGLFSQEVSEPPVREVMNGYHAYCGTYSVDEEKRVVMHHVEMSNHSHMIGNSYERTVTFFTDGRMSLENVSPENILGDGDVHHEIIWERISPC